MMNKEQTAAAEAEGRIQVLVAGAGSGKTRTLVEKVARDQRLGISPTLQVVITFTNAAANEFRERLKRAAPQDPAWVGTLHAFALKHIGPLIGEPRMIGDKEFEKLIVETLESSGINGVSLRKVREFVAGDGTGLLGKNRSARSAVVGAMGAANLLHPDMILGIFKRNLHRLGLPDHLHVYVDEFQDTSNVDAAIYRTLVDDLVATLFVVGDPRQAIFSFRGATNAEFMKLWSLADWRGQLSTNYRSRPVLINFSNEISSRLIIPDGIDPYSIAWRAEADFPSPPSFLSFTTCEQEAEAIAAHCLSILNSPVGPEGLEDLAILCRYNASVTLIRDVLKAHNVPVNCSLDYAEAIEFLDTDETVKRLLTLRELPDSTQGVWDLLVSLDAPNRTREILFPILEEVHDRESLAGALKEGILRRKSSAVTVSTIHAAKGLEWPEVWLCGADSKSFDPEDSEDVRLAYVAVTRAEDRLVISHAESRIGFRREVNLTPSPILVK